MKSIVFVAPYGLPATLRFLQAVAALTDVHLAVVAQEPAASFLRGCSGQDHDLIRAHVRCTDVLDADALHVAVTEAARELGKPVDALIGILEPMQESLASVRERLGIPGMDASSTRAFRDKAHMKGVLREHGLPCARHWLAHSVEEALLFAEEMLPLVVKPRAGYGAMHTLHAGSLDQLRSYLSSSPPSVDDPLLLEEVVEGREYSYDAMSVTGREVFHSIAVYRHPVLEVLEDPDLQWAVLMPKALDELAFGLIRRAAPAAVSALGMRTGMSHLEWFGRPDGTIAISEVAARPPGAQFMSLLSYAHDTDFYRAWAELSVFGEFQPTERKYAVAAAYLRGAGHGTVTRVHGLAEAHHEIGHLVVESVLPTRGQSKADSYEGEGYVILRHPETSVVAEALEFLLSTVRVELGGAG